MRNIWLDGIMGVVVGDALGLPVQFLEREELDANPVTEMLGYGTFNMPEGTWSDDGSLTLASFYHNDVSNMVQLSYYSRIFDLDEFAKVPREDIKSSGYVVDSLEAAIWSILNETTFEGTALRAINLGKDTDTVGAIACGLAGLYYGYQDIPAKWLNKIQRKEEIEKICIKGQDNQK